MSDFNVKQDCKKFIQHEESREAFIEHYAEVLLMYINASAEAVTDEKLKEYILDVFRKDCEKAFPAFETNENKEKKASYSTDQLNWLKYYNRRRKTEIPALFGKTKAPVFPFMALLKREGVKLLNNTPWHYGDDGKEYLTFVIEP